eukprot:13054269-Ditylum_brightwellii.AAC.3
MVSTSTANDNQNETNCSLSSPPSSFNLRNDHHLLPQSCECLPQSCQGLSNAACHQIYSLRQIRRQLHLSSGPENVCVNESNGEGAREAPALSSSVSWDSDYNTNDDYDDDDYNEDDSLQHAVEDALDDGFILCDLSVIQSKLKAWRYMFPRITPYFALKCNPDEMVAHGAFLLLSWPNYCRPAAVAAALNQRIIHHHPQ